MWTLTSHSRALIPACSALPQYYVSATFVAVLSDHVIFILHAAGDIPKRDLHLRFILHWLGQSEAGVAVQ